MLRPQGESLVLHGLGGPQHCCSPNSDSSGTVDQILLAVSPESPEFCWELILQIILCAIR